MKQIFFLLILFPFIAKTQTVYSGKDAVNNDIRLQWNKDSTFIFIQNTTNHFYQEYRGEIDKLNDSVFSFAGKMVLTQGRCLSLGDSVLYIHFDSSAMALIKNPELIYANKIRVSLTASSEETVLVPLDKSLYNSNPKKNFFTVSTGYKDPISHKMVNIIFDSDYKHCLDFYADGTIYFESILVNDLLLNTNKKSTDFTLLRKK